ncbi:vanadium-dependent haloperoxidase [Echinicola soli]|uniref:Vanadium-dependent haloperoxidase n=2 Tax=Echinicola soli TaxID=2591634 RepID=A0A514CNQ0_9BACT|nr:vanadium-dependent haloperoxidase [Echinicola soli]
MNRLPNLLRSTLLLPILLLSFCKPEADYQHLLTDSSALSTANRHLTEVMVHDIFSPPVSSRIYAYASLAAYEVTALSDSSYHSMTGKLNGFKADNFQVSLPCSYPLAALVAHYKVGQTLVFSEDKINQKRETLYQKLKDNGMPDDIFENSVKLGNAVAAHVLDYASGDNYHESRSYEKYTVTSKPGTWTPTPPAYMEGIEPHWNKIRPMTMDSAAQFVPAKPYPFDTDPESKFYKEAKAVMDIGNQLNDNQSDIAFFWDCNPYKMNIKGHVMFAEKKITPGGHWMGIASIAATGQNQDWKATSQTLAYTSIALFDAFISCWDEKYRSVLIRPETYINQYMDENWLPILQTPPFPEYTSGHSVASKAAAVALTHLIGDQFHLVDSTEVPYGLPIREFNSFKEASEEAAISRFYGGIHYMQAIDEGVEQGRMVGNHVLSKISENNKETLSSK